MSFLATQERALVAILLAVCVMLTLAPSVVAAVEPLVIVAQPQRWSSVSALIAFRQRVWFVNSRKFVNHNSAEVYSYDPQDGSLRYERHLLSQDAGRPWVHSGLLYWPFEDARFSTGHGEFAVTNGREWGWFVLPRAEVFHIHAIIAQGGDLYAATSAWRAGLQHSADRGLSWTVVHDHPTPSGRVTRFTSLGILNDQLFVGLTSRKLPGRKLFALHGGALHSVAGWPETQSAAELQGFQNWIYAVNRIGGERQVWRTDGRRVERVAALQAQGIRALHADAQNLWAAGYSAGHGYLWHSTDGENWSIEQRLSAAQPLSITSLAGRVYVGTKGPGQYGALWGPAEPAPVKPKGPLAVLPAPPPTAVGATLQSRLQRLDAALDDVSGFSSYRREVLPILYELARTRSPRVGDALASRLLRSGPQTELAIFGDVQPVSIGTIHRWYLLWSIALNGHGTVPAILLSQEWLSADNSASKFFDPLPAAAWVVTQTGQNGKPTLAALVGGLETHGQPNWLDDDRVGALTALTGKRFGYDFDAWRAWLARQP